MMHSSDESRILDKQTVEGRTTYILQDGVYLGDVFDSLPSGIINKSETGMGATTLELQSDRNSIIVEPTKITASSKAFKYKDKALYVGTPTKLHPQQTKLTDIKAYVENESIQPKKIVVVADSLWKVIEEIGESVYQDYYLFLDEIDSFQMDSTFRDSMEECLDYYKRFDPTKRLMVSATLVEFSDPALKDEPYTTFKYENPTARNISLVHCGNSSVYGNLLGSVFDQIKLRIEESPEDKLKVAYNSVWNSRALANALINEGVLAIDEVGILCSVNNKNELGGLYVELDDDTLPKRVNFVTSAYFTGYDLKEPYHLISVSGVQKGIHSLSDKKLKQIAGRCREELYSETIVYETRSLENDSITTIETLVDAAEKEILAISCLELNYESNPLLSSQLSRIRKLVLDNTHEDEFRLVRRNSDQQNVISYLNIDANLENQRVRRELYQSSDFLKDLLEGQGHCITITANEYTPTSLLIPRDLSNEVRVESLTTLINKLRSVTPTQDNLRSLDVNLNQREKLVLSTYEDFHLYIDRDQLLDKIEKVAMGRDDRAFKNLIFSAKIAVLPSNHIYLRRVREFIVIDQEYTNVDLVNAWNAISQSLGLHSKYSESQSVKVLKLTKAHFKTYRLKYKRGHKIKSMNPYGFKIIQAKTDRADDITKILKTYFEYYA